MITRKGKAIMGGMTTKEKIMEEALTLFSTRGYDPVSVREIARAVGIKESSLYNHFKSKQDIFDTIVRVYSQRGEGLFNQFDLSVEEGVDSVDDQTIELYKNMTPDQFAEMSSRIFEFYFADEINVKLRKLLTIEQYRNPELGALYRSLSFDSSLSYQTILFQKLMEVNAIKKMDPKLLALEFFAPIFLIFYKFDNNEENLAEARQLFIDHVNHFNHLYK